MQCGFKNLHGLGLLKLTEKDSEIRTLADNNIELRALSEDS